ncbi:Esterase E4 [Frankliniella fusca]|uniref:Esterase E4 n=1 Tax=Frankliniella fusca TaxID=407009 RepID=A0AAE1HFK2_9NEOP|nr:Esterase E4 [Frankliniella fusca]
MKSNSMYLDDIVIGVDTNRLAELRARNGKSTTFVYRFGVRAKYSTSPLADPGQEAGGAVHSDELGYLWKMDMLQQQLSGDDLASKTLRRMVNMWSSFVRSGSQKLTDHKRYGSRALKLAGAMGHKRYGSEELQLASATGHNQAR